MVTAYTQHMGRLSQPASQPARHFIDLQEKFTASTAAFTEYFSGMWEDFLEVVSVSAALSWGIQDGGINQMMFDRAITVMKAGGTIPTIVMIDNRTGEVTTAAEVI